MFNPQLLIAVIYTTFSYLLMNFFPDISYLIINYFFEICILSISFSEKQFTTDFIVCGISSFSGNQVLLSYDEEEVKQEVRILLNMKYFAQATLNLLQA